jgi:hypothetical protein
VGIGDRAGAKLVSSTHLLDHRSMLHDEQPLAEMRHDREVMADQDVGKPVLRP